ncbi:FAD/NAD(P)-binding protein [Streptomyces harbinensis]|uniref:FAD/NAD(P)-binding protein n=1 Tax=Streptomyces harbinensis TaxID=1176198 RepID=UPI003688D243
MSGLPLPYAVTGREEETADTATLTLEPVADPLPPFRPGQFAMVGSFGHGEVPLSFSGGSPSTETLAHTVRAVGPVTRALFALRTGHQLTVRGPYGTGWDLSGAVGHDVLVIAGGLGLAPLRPLLLHALGRVRDFSSVSVLIGARSPDDVLYGAQSGEWAVRTRVARTVDRPGPGWEGEVGVVTTLLGRTPYRPERTSAFLCGPEVMMRATARELMRRGVPAARVQVSLERNMRCGTGHCGHCQLGPLLLCRDGPVVRWDEAGPLLAVREL